METQSERMTEQLDENHDRGKTYSLYGMFAGSFDDICSVAAVSEDFLMQVTARKAKVLKYEAKVWSLSALRTPF